MVSRNVLPAWLRAGIGLCVLGIPIAAQAKPSLAILGIEALDDSPDPKQQNQTADVAKRLTDALRARAEHARATFDPAGGTKDLAEIKLVNGCDDSDLKCMSKVGSDLGAKRLIYGGLKRTGTGFAINLRFVNVETKTSERSVADKLAAADATPAALDKLADKIFGDLTGVAAEPVGGGASTGTIVVSAPTGASGPVLVDHTAVGELSAGQLTIKGVAAGPHTVEIQAKGYDHWSGNVDVAAGQDTRLDAELIAENGGPAVGGGSGSRPGKTYRILFWSTLVGTAAGVAAFTVTGLQVRSAESDKNDSIRRSQMDTDPSNDITTTGDACAQASMKNYKELVDICNNGKSKATLTNVLIGATAVLGLASAFFYYKGYLASPVTRENTREARRRIQVGPEVYGDKGGGLRALVEF